MEESRLWDGTADPEIIFFIEACEVALHLFQDGGIYF